MSVGDLRRLVLRATPRVEDVRAPDRSDFVKREHTHLTLREVVDALDALEFTVNSFERRMREVLVDPSIGARGETYNTSSGPILKEATTLASETAVHGLLRILGSVRVMSPALPKAQDVAASDDASMTEVAEAGGDDDAGAEDWKEALLREKTAGAECFKQKDFGGAVDKYGAAIRVALRAGCAHAETAAIHTLYSNRSAALLSLGEAVAALEDARRCVRACTTWPKGRFREGCALRQLGRYTEAIEAFEAGEQLEPDNKDWAREVDKTETLLMAEPVALVRQLILHLTPELLRAWMRGKVAGEEAVLQLQVNGELSEVGAPKWVRIRNKESPAKAQVRFALCQRQDYLSNLAANLAQPPERGGVAVVDASGAPLKIVDIVSFLDSTRGEDVAVFHIDVRVSGQMRALIGSMACGEDIQTYIPQAKDPRPPGGSVEGVLQLQRADGFPKALPRLLGFQSIPGDLNFPVVDLARDCPQAA